MSQAHSFFIPEPEYLIDVESFLSYLFVIISVFHECLLCGSSRSTKFGVQDHMRGKGHCRVDLEDEQNQFKQFYDFSGDIDAEAVDLDEEVILIPDEDKLHLPSGKTLGHRLDVHHSRRTRSERSSPRSYSRQQLLTEPESDMEPAESKDRRIVMRAGTTTSMIGVPEPQRRALVAVEKKMLTIETIARNEYQSILEKGGNKQKFYRALGIGKKMGGLEKRLG
jgi:pre-60S factor REI1